MDFIWYKGYCTLNKVWRLLTICFSFYWKPNICDSSINYFLITKSHALHLKHCWGLHDASFTFTTWEKCSLKTWAFHIHLNIKGSLASCFVSISKHIKDNFEVYRSLKLQDYMQLDILCFTLSWIWKKKKRIHLFMYEYHQPNSL